MLQIRYLERLSSYVISVEVLTCLILLVSLPILSLILKHYSLTILWSPAMWAVENKPPVRSRFGSTDHYFLSNSITFAFSHRIFELVNSKLYHHISHNQIVCQNPRKFPLKWMVLNCCCKKVKFKWRKSEASCLLWWILDSDCHHVLILDLLKTRPYGSQRVPDQL